MPRDNTDPLPAWIKPRHPIHLVQWVWKGDQEIPLTVNGDFMGRTKTVYQVRNHKGQIHDTPREFWTPCLPA